MTRLLVAICSVCCLAGCIPSAKPTAPANDTASAQETTQGSLEQAAPDEPTEPMVTVADTESVPGAESDDVEVISFDDLNLNMGADVRFRPFMLQDRRAEALLEHRVNLAGYINPTDRMTGITDFILLRNLECKFGPGGQADHLVHVLMQDGTSADFTDQVVYVEGTLKLNPFHSPDGATTWSIYDLHGVRVSTTPPGRTR